MRKPYGVRQARFERKRLRRKGHNAEIRRAKVLAAKNQNKPRLVRKIGIEAIKAFIKTKVQEAGDDGKD